MKVIIGLFLTLSITVAQSSADKQFEDIAQLPTFFVGFLKHYSLRHEVQKRPGAKFVLKDEVRPSNPIKGQFRLKE